jgi:hypothetical protein
MPQKHLLTNGEVQALRPEERARYVHKLILDVLDVRKDKTLSEVIEASGVARPTVTKHLGLLVALQQVKKEERGLGRNKISFYKKVGNVLENNEHIFEGDGNIRYSFFTIESDEGKAICIQQKEEDEYKASSVRGTIVIKYDNVQQFVKELNTFAARVIKK